LYERFAGRLYTRVLLPKLGDEQAAEDALAETFRTALERLDQYRDRGSSVWYWLARIASNKATDMYRRRARTKRVLSNFESLLEPMATTPGLADDELATSRRRQQLVEAVKKTLGGINPRYRRAIELRFLEERSRADCADQMEVKLGTFDVLLLRSLRAFRKQWTTLAPPDEVGAGAET